jgi:hypothetical protein
MALDVAMETAVSDEEDYIASAIRAREESVSFFSSKRKPERERWVVTEFLTNLGIEPSETEVVSAADEPPDVEYRDARFEVKEIMDVGKRRHAKYKESLRRAKEAKTISELFEDYTPRDIKYSEICGRIESEITTLPLYAPATKRQLDLLFYVNLEDVHGYVTSELPPATKFAELGWRSISFLAGPMSVVLYAAADAPRLIKEREGKVTRKGKSDTA